MRLQQRPHPAQAVAAKWEADPLRMLQELQVHQVELEMQNAELQEARDRLEGALEKYTDLYDFAPVGYLSVDEAGQVLEANLTSAALLRVGRAQLLSRRLPPFVAGADRPNFLKFLPAVFASAKKQVCEALLVRADGSSFWAGIHGTTALSAKSPRKWCRMVISDITPLKEAENVLRRSEALLSAVFAQAPVGMYVVNARFQLQEINPTALRLFGKIHPLLGRNFSEIVHLLWPRPAADAALVRFRHTLKTGAPYQSPEFAERRQDTGAREVYEWQIQRVILPAGEHGVVCFFNNITVRKEAEAAQRRAAVLTASNQKLKLEIDRRKASEDSLRKSEQHQRQLFDQSRLMQEQLRYLSRQVLRAQEEERKRISRELHDVIAQTLTGINLRLAALKKSASTDQNGFNRSIALTQKLVEKSVSLVHDFARELRPAVLDDLGLVPALHTFMKDFTVQTGVRTQLTAFAAVEQLDTIQRTVLFRVAQEALTNVAKHARASRVAVNIQKLPHHISMTITDNGQSFRAPPGWQTRGGKRLGLLGMRERVEMVGGNFAVESTPGKGTTIAAQLPLGKALRGGALRESAETLSQIL